MELEIQKPLADTNVISAHPQHQTFGLDQARIVAPGSPARSVMLHRLSRRGPGQMPPLVSRVVDQAAVDLFRAWIEEMEPTHNFIKAWQIQDLTSELPNLSGDRSLEAGATAYRELGCIQCHRRAGEGGGSGPDLTGIAKRLQPAEVLESIIAPSQKVAPEYATTVIQTSDGQVISGRVERSTDDAVLLRRTTDPFAPPVLISKDNIEQQRLSPQSIMPSGLLNSLEQGQILDLLAYLLQ